MVISKVVRTAAQHTAFAWRRRQVLPFLPRFHRVVRILHVRGCLSIPRHCRITLPRRTGWRLQGSSPRRWWCSGWWRHSWPSPGQPYRPRGTRGHRFHALPFPIPPRWAGAPASPYPVFAPGSPLLLHRRATLRPASGQRPALRTSLHRQTGWLGRLKGAGGSRGVVRDSSSSPQLDSPFFPNPCPFRLLPSSGRRHSRPASAKERY